MLDREYLNRVLANMHSGQWFGWRKEDDNGNKIPNDQRMTYDNIKIIKEGATMPTESEVNAKIEELKQEEIDREARKASAKTKLEALGLTTEEIKEAFGI